MSSHESEVPGQGKSHARATTGTALVLSPKPQPQTCNNLRRMTPKGKPTQTSKEVIPPMREDKRGARHKKNYTKKRRM